MVQIKIPVSALSVKDEDGKEVTPEPGDEVEVKGVVVLVDGKDAVVKLDSELVEEGKEQPKPGDIPTREQLMAELEKSDEIFGA